jgi:hypothetical protein
VRDAVNSNSGSCLHLCAISTGLPSHDHRASFRASFYVCFCFVSALLARFSAARLQCFSIRFCAVFAQWRRNAATAAMDRRMERGSSSDEGEPHCGCVAWRSDAAGLRSGEVRGGDGLHPCLNGGIAAQCQGAACGRADTAVSGKTATGKGDAAGFRTGRGMPGR